MRSPSRRLHDYLRKTTPEGAVIKKHAHAVTLAAAGLIVPSLWAIHLRHLGIKENEPEWVWGAETLWKIHAGIGLLAAVLWLFEKPKPTRFLPVDPHDEE